MEKLRILAARKYYLLSTHRYYFFTGHKVYEESLILTVTNDGGSICFTFVDLSSNEEIAYENPTSGEYIIPLKKGSKMKLVITSSNARGAYKIAKRTVKE